MIAVKEKKLTVTNVELPLKQVTCVDLEKDSPSLSDLVNTPTLFEIFTRYCDEKKYLASELINELINRFNFTKKMLSEYSGVSIKTINRWMNQSAKPRFKYYHKVFLLHHISKEIYLIFF